MGDEQLTWAEVDERVSRIAAVLAEDGVGRGDVVVLLGDNSPSYLCVLFGISRLGATASLINNHLEGSPLEHAIVSSRSKLALVQTGFLPAFAISTGFRPCAWSASTWGLRIAWRGLRRLGLA